VLVISLGVITGVGGGILRDVLTNSMPMVFCKHVYAVASMTGAVVYYVLAMLGMSAFLCELVAMVLIFALRILATIFKWNLPKVNL